MPDTRAPRETGTTQRVGVLEAEVARDLVETGVSGLIPRGGHEHGGTGSRCDGRAHRIRFEELAGEPVRLSPRTDASACRSSTPAGPPGPTSSGAHP
ncbi:hypothetical protein ACWDUX_06580 [Streptomyces sp. NPDC003444]